MDNNQNPFAFLNDTTGAAKPKQATGGGDFSFLQAQDKTLRAALTADDLGLLAKEEGAAHLMPVINAIYGQESGAGANGKTSTDGARGGMQVMPDTFRRFAKQGESIDNPVDNMRVGMRIIKTLGDKFGNDPAKIATGYFSGEGNVNAGSGSAWKNDHKDGNGKRVSGYVSDVLGRLSPIKEAKAEESLPDLSQFPKWSEISTSERYLSLSDTEKTKLKGDYFDDVLAPHAGAGAAKAREQFMVQRDAPPSFDEKLSAKMAGIVPAVQDLLGVGGKKGTGSVMDGYTPGAEPTSGAKLQDAMQTSKTLQNVDGSVENRRARLITQGEAPEFADRAAREAAAAGVAPGAEIAFMQKQFGTVGKSGYDFDTKELFNKQAGVNNPLVRGVAKAGLGTTKALSGYTQFMGDVLGIEGMQAAGTNAGQWARGKEEAIGEKGNFLERNLEGAINSIGQQLPLMVAGVSLETQALPLAGMAMQTFGQEYSDGRSVGQTPAQATQRAAVFAAFEVIGEKFGLGDSMKAIKAAARGMPNDQIVGFLWSALKKEVPGELLTTTGQFGTDKLPEIGLNQGATGEDYLKQVGDTIAQTIMQSGVMAGGTTGVSTAVRYLRDKSDNANVDAIHAEDVRQKSLDRWNAGLLGVPREAVQSVQTPDGRIEPNTAPVTSQQAAAAEPAPIDVHPTSAVADSIVADLATQNGIPHEFVLPQQKNKLPGTPESNDVNDQDVMDYAEMRHRQLVAKRDGRIQQVPTDAGMMDQEVPGQALTPQEAAELAVLESQDPAEIRSFYGMNQPIPSDQSANQSSAQTPAPAVAPVEQPAQGTVFPTATEPGLVAAQENQNAQNPTQAEPIGSAPSQVAVEPTGQPVRPAQEQQPTGQGAAAQANPVNPVGIAQQQVQPNGSVTPEFDVSGRNEQQLQYLAEHGQEGWKEAAQAELAKRGAAQPVGPQGQFKTADEAQAYISAQRRRGGGKLPKALPLPFTDGSFGLATEGQAGWAEATAFAKANAPKTEKEAKAKRQKQQSVEPQKATEDSLKAASEWWSVHSAADRKSLLLEQYSEAIAATNSELTWDELGSGMQTRIAELYDARQVKPWTGERKTEQDAKIRRKAEEIHAKANDLLGGTFKLSVDQVETLIHEKGMETAEKTLEGLKKSVKEAAKRNKPAKPKGQKNGTEAAETEQAEKEKPQAPDAGTGEAVSQKPKTEKEAKIAKAASDMAAKAGQPVVDGVEAIASRIQQSIAEHNIKANEKIAREQVAKGYITQEQADADLDRTRKMWEDVKPNERTLALAKAIAAKDPRPLVGAWAKEGQGTYGNEGSMAAFEKISGLKLLRLGSAARAKAIFDWAGWSEDRVAADVAERRKANAEQKAAYEAKHQKEHDERIEKRAASELVEFRDTGEKKGIKEYIDDLVAQGFSRIITSKVGAITKTYLANEQGTGYPLPVGLMRDYAELAVRMAVTPKPEAAADKPKTEKEANARRESGAYRQGRNAAFRGYSIQTPTNIRKSVDKEAYQAGWMEGKREADSLLDGKDRVTVGNRTAVPKIADSNGDFVVVWSEERSGKEFKSAEEALKGLRELEEKDKEFEDSLQDIAPRKPKTEREAKAIRESMVAFKHEGLNIYPVKVGGEMKWAVQTVENAAREKSSERQIGGDPLLSSKESAIAEAERMVKEAAAREYDRKEIEANAQEAAAAKEAAAESKNALLGDFYAKKERIVRERAAVTLSKAIRYEGKVMTRAEWVKSLVDSGAKLTVNQVNKIKPMSRTQFNRASNAEQRSHDEKVKRGGKVPEYMIGDYVVNKTEYDYAEYLASANVSKTAENIDTSKPSVEAVDTSTPEKKSAKAAKTEKSVKADKLKAQLEEHFAPGNIIYNAYWKTHNRVLGFDWNNGNWIVTEEEVKQQGGEWVKSGDKRVHSTRPDAKDQVVARAEPKNATADTTAADMTPDNLQNFGKELEGGRRNRAPSLDKELSEHEIAGQPLSKIWPADEIDGIEDKFAAAVAFAARAEIPAKPRTSYKVARWAQQVQTLRQLAAGIVRVGNDKARDVFAQAMKGSIHFRAKVALLEAVDRDQWSRIGNVYEYPNSYRYDESGAKIPTAFVSVEIDGKNNRFDGAKSVSEVIEQVNVLLGKEAEDKKMAFEVRGRTGSYSINKKGDKEYRKLKTFTDSKEAFAYIKDNYADLVAAWDAVKERDNVGKGDVRNAENRPRTGKDWLEGKDVTAQQFIDDLGFRGVEFGKWVGQGTGAKERQGMLNQAYEALMDLATIIGVPPKAISLNGSMGLAFGSRGSGNASAHFEPGNLVINLTKTKGAGTLAHEWFHALDNYFARMRGGEKTMKELGSQDEYRRQNFVTYKPEPLMVHKVQRSTPLTKARLEQYHKENPKSQYFNPDNWQVDPKHPAGVRPVVEKAFADLVEALDKSPMTMRAKRNDKGKDGYWGRIIERAARSFENYVIHKMDQDGYQNDYLANVVPIEDFQRDEGRYPYLRPEEVKPVSDAFDRLFKTVETKKADDGHVTMFSRSSANASGKWYRSQLETAIDQAPDRIFGKAAQFKLWLASNAAKLGIKKDEIEWSGINEFLDLRQGSNVPKQDLLEFLSNNSVKVQDVMKHNAGKDLYVEESRDEEGTWLVFDADDNVIEAFDSRKSAEGFLTSATKYGSYTLPGGTNYKELLLTLPDHGAESVHDQRQRLKEKYGVESWLDLTDAQKEDLRKSDEKANLPRVQYKSGHWAEPNILAHVRFNDRTDADGNKVLFVEEIQSDWAQAGRKLGFGYKDNAPLTAEEDRELMNLYGMRAYARTEAQTARMHELNNRLNASQGKSGIPDAPFVKDTKAWVALSIKRMIAYAAENGYDKVAFVNGEQSAERYDLSKQIDKVEYTEGGVLYAWDKSGNEVMRKKMPESEVEDHIGKDLAVRLLSAEKGKYNSRSLSGADIKVGGEGMKSFYDKIVPQVANDVLKKLGGGKVEPLFDVTRNTQMAAFPEGNQWVVTDAEDGSVEHGKFDTQAEAMAFIKASRSAQLGFTITPEMREKVAKGLPLFSRGKSGQGMALRDLKAIVDRARSSLKNLPQVHVLQSPAGLDMENPSQKRLHQEIYRRGAESDVEGVSHDGEIYLFADNLADEFRAEHVLVNHEVGHYGLREVFGRSGLDPILNTIYMTNAKVRKQADALRDKFGLESNAEATEEILVEMAPKELIKLNAWRRLVRHIRDWLSGHGFGKVAERLNSLLKAGMTEQQKADMLVADVVNAARNWVRNGTPSQSSTVQETKLSQADQNDSDLLKRDRANIETATRRLGKFVDAFVDGQVKDGDTQIIGDTPTVLQALGAENLPVQIDGATLHKILDGKHRYFITPEMLKQVPEHFYDPLAVFDSPKDGKPGKIVLTELSDAITGKPVVVAVHLSKKSGRITVNEISSVYETSDGTQRSKLTPEALEYYRNEKSLEQTTTPNLSTPLAGVVQSAQDLGKNILTERDVVKQYGPRFSRKPYGEVVRDLQSNAVQFFGNQVLKTFNTLNKTINTQFHKALKDKDFGRVYNLIQSMQNHVATASSRPAELAPGVLPRVDSFVESVKTLFSAERNKAIDRAGMALFEGTLAGNSVMDGKVWTDEQLVSQFGLNATEIALYRQARKAIDASLTELAAAEAYALAEKYLPKAIRDDIIESPDDAEALIMEALGRQIDMARKVNLDEATQAGMADAKAKVEAIFSQADKLKKAGYAPLMRFGKYNLTVEALDPETGNLLRDENDNPVTLYYGRFDSQSKLRDAENELRRLYSDNPDVRFTSGVVNDSANELYRGVSPETLAVFADAIGADKLMDAHIRLVLSERSSMKRKLERKGTPGYSGDLQRVLANFVTSNARQASQQLYGTAVNRAIRRIPREKGDVQKEALALRNYVIDPNDNGALGANIMFAWFLGFSPASAAINMTQTLTMTLPHLSQFGNASAALTKALPFATGKKEIKDQELRQALKKASLQGIVDAQEVFHLYSIGTRSMASGSRSQSFMTLAGLMFAGIEGFNRRIAFIAAWNMAKDNGNKDAYLFAVDAVNQTQGIYAKTNRPNWARKPVGRAVFTFKTYSIAYIELMHRMWKSGANGKKAVMLMMAVLLLAAGEEGLPFMQDLNDIIDTIGQWMGYDTNTVRWKRRHAYELLGQVAGDIALYGASSMLPLDFHGRMGMGNLIPGTGAFKRSNGPADYGRAVSEVVGASAGFANQVSDAIDAIGKPVADYKKAGTNLLPKAFKDLVNAGDMLVRGYATDAAGNKTVNTTPLDAAVKATGFNPTVVAKKTRATMPLQQDIRLNRNVESGIVNAWAVAIVNQDKGGIAAAQKALTDWNSKNPESPIRINPSQIRDLVRKMTTGKDERILKTAPKEIRGRIGLELLKK